MTSNMSHIDIFKLEQHRKGEEHLTCPRPLQRLLRCTSTPPPAHAHFGMRNASIGSAPRLAIRKGLRAVGGNLGLALANISA
jgi:hypothetical protein